MLNISSIPIRSALYIHSIFFLNHLDCFEATEDATFCAEQGKYIINDMIVLGMIAHSNPLLY